MLIWPKHIVVGLCYLISSDGSIKLHETKESTRIKHGISEVKSIVISYSSEEDWLKQIQKVMRIHKIGTSIHGPFPQSSKAFIEKYKSKSKDRYYLRLNRKYPKGRHGGLDQWQVFRNSMEHWGVQDYLIKRKYAILCKITKPMPLVEEAKIQHSLHARPCMIGSESPIPLACFY